MAPSRPGHAGRRKTTLGDARFLDGPTWNRVASALSLTPREIDVVRGLCEGKKEAAIAQELGIAPSTVHTHVKRIFLKTRSHNRVSLVMRIFRVLHEHRRTTDSKQH